MTTFENLTSEEMLADPARYHVGCDHETGDCEYADRDDDAFPEETDDDEAPHLHVSSWAVDCDGPIERSYVERTRTLEEWIGAEVTMAFARDCLNPSVRGTYDHWAEVSYPTDEGGFTTEARVCTEVCPDVNTYRDVRAEQEGY